MFYYEIRTYAYKQDPLVLGNNLPDFLVIGGKDTFEAKEYIINNKKEIIVLSIPDFSITGTIVILNTSNNSFLEYSIIS